MDGGSEREARLRGFRRQRRRNPTLDAVRVGGGAHQEGGRGRENGKISSPLLPFRPFPGSSSQLYSNAQTTTTTPSGIQEGGGGQALLSSFRFPSSPPLLLLGFPAKTHTLHSTSLLSSSPLSPNTQRRDWTEGERRERRDRFLGDRLHHWQSADQRVERRRRRRRRH